MNINKQVKEEKNWMVNKCIENERLYSLQRNANGQVISQDKEK